MRTASFYSDTGEVRVTPIGKFVEDREPHTFKVEIVPFSILLPAESIIVEEPYYFIAAGEALDRYKEKYGLNPSETWTFNN